MDHDDLRLKIAEDMPRTTGELERLVRIPSVGHEGHDPAQVRASAEATVEVLRASGVAARLIELAGGHPAVYGELPGPKGSPTVLLYAHHDVQPPGPLDAWTSPPFEPQLREGRMYGRGSADNKSGIVVHGAALRALGAHTGHDVPVNVKILIEGEEECSTEHLPQLVGGQGDLLRADVAVIADGGNHRTGHPTLTSSLRGLTDCVVSVEVLPSARHSGAFGGPIPDAITVLSRMISTLHDDAGDVAIAGLTASGWMGTPITEEEIREATGLHDSVEMIGTGPLADRLLSRPAVAVIGFDAPSVRESSNQIVPRASARVSLRVAPEEDPAYAREALQRHLREAAPWGVHVDIRPGEAGKGHLVDEGSDIYRVAIDALSTAFGREVQRRGAGGAIPFVSELTGAFPDMEIVIWGAGDERSNWHSIDESVDLGEIERLATAEALFIDRIGALART